MMETEKMGPSGTGAGVCVTWVVLCMETGKAQREQPWEGGFACEELTCGAGGGTTGSDAQATEWSPGAGSEVAVGRCGMEDTSRGSGMGRSS